MCFIILYEEISPEVPEEPSERYNQNVYADWWSIIEVFANSKIHKTKIKFYTSSVAR